VTVVLLGNLRKPFNGKIDEDSEFPVSLETPIASSLPYLIGQCHLG